MAHPLALYIFAQEKSHLRKVTSECGFSGGCINDVIIHLATSEMPFGGFGKAVWEAITARRLRNLFPLQEHCDKDLD